MATLRNGSNGAAVQRRVVWENRHVIEVVPTPLRALVAEIALALGWSLEAVRLCLARVNVKFICIICCLHQRQLLEMLDILEWLSPVRRTVKGSKMRKPGFLKPGFYLKSRNGLI